MQLRLVHRVMDERKQAEAELFKVSQRHVKQSIVSLETILTESFDRLDDLHKDKGKLRGIPTGFRDLDSVLAGEEAAPSPDADPLVFRRAAHRSVLEGCPEAVIPVGSRHSYDEGSPSGRASSCSADGSSSTWRSPPS